MDSIGAMINTQEDCSLKQLDVASSITDRLNNKKRKLETELAETNAALDALEKNPEVAKVLTLVGRAMGGRY